MSTDARPAIVMYVHINIILCLRQKKRNERKFATTEATTTATKILGAGLDKSRTSIAQTHKRKTALTFSEIEVHHVY